MEDHITDTFSHSESPNTQASARSDANPGVVVSPQKNIACIVDRLGHHPYKVGFVLGGLYV